MHYMWLYRLGNHGPLGHGERAGHRVAMFIITLAQVHGLSALHVVDYDTIKVTMSLLLYMYDPLLCTND